MAAAQRILMVTAPFLVVFLLHYASAHAYASICTPLSITGMFQSMITTGSPVCKVLLDALTYTSNTYTTIVAGAIGAFLLHLNNGLKQLPSSSKE